MFLTTPVFASSRLQRSGSSGDPGQGQIYYLTPDRRKIAGLDAEVRRLRQENIDLKNCFEQQMKVVGQVVIPNRNKLVDVLERHKVYDATFKQVDANRKKFRAFMDQVESFMTSYQAIYSLRTIQIAENTQRSTQNEKRVAAVATKLQEVVIALSEKKVITL